MAESKMPPSYPETGLEPGPSPRGPRQRWKEFSNRTKNKFSRFGKAWSDRLTVGQLLGLCAIASFGLGYLSHDGFTNWFSSNPNTESRCKHPGTPSLGVYVNRHHHGAHIHIQSDHEHHRHCRHSDTYVRPVQTGHFQFHHGPEGKRQGVSVISVVQDSPAHHAGIQVQDHIFAIDNVLVKDTQELKHLIQRRCIGDVVQIAYLRNNALLQTKASLKAIPNDF